jgi:hypothetical protein
VLHPELLGCRHIHITKVNPFEAQTLQLLIQLTVTQRRGPHVYTSAPLA